MLITLFITLWRENTIQRAFGAQLIEFLNDEPAIVESWLSCSIFVVRNTRLPPTKHGSQLILGKSEGLPRLGDVVHCYLNMNAMRELNTLRVWLSTPFVF